MTTEMIEFIFGAFMLIIALLGAYEYGKSDGNSYRGRKRK